MTLNDVMYKLSTSLWSKYSNSRRPVIENSVKRTPAPYMGSVPESLSFWVPTLASEFQAPAPSFPNTPKVPKFNPARPKALNEYLIEILYKMYKRFLMTYVQ